MDLLPEMLEEGRRILLFSQFTSMLAIIEAELAKKKIHYVLLTGQTRDRATPVEQFQKGEVPLFLISLKAGGTGLNLTAADTVIHSTRGGIRRWKTRPPTAPIASVRIRKFSFTS